MFEDVLEIIKKAGIFLILSQTVLQLCVSEIYEKYIKRLMDIICSLAALLVFWWLYLIVAILVKVKLGSPVLFTQPRPGLVDPETGKEIVFKIKKRRLTVDKSQKNGRLKSAVFYKYEIYH